MNKILKWCFFGYTLSIFCAIWPNMEQPKVQLLVFQTGGMVLWIISSVADSVRRRPKEHLAIFFTVLAFSLYYKTHYGFFSLSNVFIASLVYMVISEKVKKEWIISAIFWASLIQIPVSVGQIFGYDPIFNYTLAPTTKELARQATGFIGLRSFLCIFFATVSMLFMTIENNFMLLYGLFLSILTFAFRGIAGIGGIMASWLLWSTKRGKYLFLKVLLVCACVLIPQASYIWNTKSTVRLMVWRLFFDASFSSVYIGHGIGSVKNFLPVLVTNGWGMAWSDIKNSYLAVFFEMGIVGLFLIGFLFRNAVALYKFEYIPVVFYAFLVLAFSSLFQTTYIYPSISYLWILVFSLIHIEMEERKKYET